MEGGRGIRYEWRRLDGSMGETRDAQMNEEEEEEEEACLQRLVAEFLRIALHRSCAYFCANCYKRILHGGKENVGGGKEGIFFHLFPVDLTLSSIPFSLFLLLAVSFLLFFQRPIFPIGRRTREGKSEG